MGNIIPPVAMVTTTKGVHNHLTLVTLKNDLRMTYEQIATKLRCNFHFHMTVMHLKGRIKPTKVYAFEREGYKIYSVERQDYKNLCSWLYSGTSLIRTPLGLKYLSQLMRCLYFRGRLICIYIKLGRCRLS